MGFKFRVQSTPNGLGGALFDAARDEVNFQRTLETQRLRLAEEAQERENTRLALQTKVADLQAQNQAATAARADRRLSLDEATARVRADQGAAGLNLQASSLDLQARGQEQRGQQLDLALNRENRIAAGAQDNRAAAARGEQRELLRMGARPIAADTKPAGGVTVYQDGQGRAWGIPAAAGKDGLKQLIPWIRHNIETADQDLTRRLKEREELKEQIDKANSGVQNDRATLASGKKYSKERTAEIKARVEDADARIAELTKELSGIETRAEGIAKRDAMRGVYTSFVTGMGIPPEAAGIIPGLNAGAPQAATQAAPKPTGPLPKLSPAPFLPKDVPPPDLSRIRPEQRQEVAASWNDHLVRVAAVAKKLARAEAQKQIAEAELATAKTKAEKRDAARRLEDIAAVLARLAKHVGAGQDSLTKFAKDLAPRKTQ
jgi:hypothetical protein